MIESQLGVPAESALAAPVPGPRASRILRMRGGRLPSGRMLDDLGASRAAGPRGTALRPRAVLFDLDGVLVDSYEVWFHLLNATARAFAAPSIDRETFAESWGQGVNADVERFFPRRTIAETEAFYHAHFMGFRDHLAVTSDAARVVEALHAGGLGLAVVTNTPAPLAREILAHAGIAIATVVGGTDVPRPKPAPDMLLEACRRLAIRPEHACLVGDSGYDAGAAQAAGVPFVGYRRAGDRRIEALSSLLGLVAAPGADSGTHG